MSRIGLLSAIAILPLFATNAQAAVIFNFDATQPIQSFSAAIGIVNPNFTYNPAIQGAITSIDFSIQTEQVQNFSPVFGPASTIGASAVIEQNGNFFLAQGRTQFLGDGIWVTVAATGWTATNFQLINLTNSSILDAHGNLIAPGQFDTGFNPDFSASGAPIQFGTGGTFAFTCGSGGAINLSCPFQVQEYTARQNMMYSINDPIMFSDINFLDLGNYNIFDIVTASDPAGALNSNVTIPEPLTISMFGAGLAGAMLLRKRRKAKA